MKVIRKQTNSRNCIVCGMENNSGLKAPFYVLDDNSVATIFEFQSIHQSYPERVHGGLVSALLDELMGRALWINKPTEYGVTTTLNITYRKPTPYNQKLKARGYITFEGGRGFSAKGELYDMNDNLLAEGSAKYLILPSKLAFAGDFNEKEEMCYDIVDDVKEINFPSRKD